jgi:hypothetical protein
MRNHLFRWSTPLRRVGRPHPLCNLRAFLPPLPDPQMRCVWARGASLNLTSIPQPTGPEAPLFDHCVAAKEPFAISFDRRLQPQRFSLGISKVCAHQHNARYGPLSTKDKIAEILVFSEQKSLLAQRERDDSGVVQPCGRFRHIEYLVASRAQYCDQRRRDAFVSEPAHASAVNNVFVGEIVRGKRLRGPDIVKCEPWMVRED